MVSVVLAMLLSTVAVVAPQADEASAQTGGLNSWVRHDLPTTQYWQMAPNTDIWDLTAADDGTLFALVEDTSGTQDLEDILGPVTPVVWDGLRWAVFPAWSDVSLFKSIDGGYTWTLVWHIPASETGAPLSVIPQPGYVDGDAANDVVFVATGTRMIEPPIVPLSPPFVVGGPGTGDIYRSMDGGSNFTRVTPRNPAIAVGGTITSMDVAENRNAPGTYMVAVGTSVTGLVPGQNEGVWTWNEDNDRDWKDKQVSTALPPAPFPGTMPAGNGMSALQVLFSPDWVEDGCLMATIVDMGMWIASPGPGTYVCFYDDLDGTWGGDVDSPTNALIMPTPVAPDFAGGASMAVGDDFAKTTNTHVFVSIHTWINIPRTEDVYRIRGLSTVTGPSTVSAMGLGPIINPAGPAGLHPRLCDVLVQGSAASGSVYVGCEFPNRQAQVFVGTQATLWPNWTPAFKPPSGCWPVLLTDMSGTLMEASGNDDITSGGVHKMVEGSAGRKVYNGIGLLDDIAVSEDIPGYVNPGTFWGSMAGTSWCLAEAASEEVSPMYNADELIYVATYSEWYQPGMDDNRQETELSLWRWTDGIHWERIMYERVTLPTTFAPGNNHQYAGKPMNIPELMLSRTNMWTWWPRVTRSFSEDPYVFLLGGRAGFASNWMQEWLWYSPDLGDSWIPFQQMPIGAFDLTFPLPPPSRAGLSDCGWWVLDNNTLFMGDVAGWVYKTTDRGASWTEGALTAAGLDITSIVTSPIYSETGSSDKCVLVGTHDFMGDLKHEVWLSRDGCVQDLENVGAEICTSPLFIGLTFGIPSLGGDTGLTVVNFDPGWEINNIVYAAASNWLDRWELVGTGSKVLTRIDTSDVGVYRAEVNLNDPSASTWEQIWDADDFNEAAEVGPVPHEGMLPAWDVLRHTYITDIQVGNEGSLYVPFSLWDVSYNIQPGVAPPIIPERPPSPRMVGRLTLGGVLRCLEPTQKVTEWEVIDRKLGEWDGLFLNRAVAGGSNTLISLAYDIQEWRFKLAIYDDTLCTKSTPSEPMAGDTAVGTLYGNNKVSVVLDWSQLDADVYSWQVDDDCGFAPPYIASGATSEELVTVTGLDPDVRYCWRVRAEEPALSRWSDAQNFQTIIGPELIAPRLQSPAAGAVILETRPVFQWSAIGWADSYMLQVATDSGFASSALVVNENLGNTQGLQSPTDLADGIYYWRVKASSATSETPWSATGIFSVGEMADGGTEAWVWVLVALGVILLLMLLWLILKTRTTV
jgi:hypothetical protein